MGGLAWLEGGLDTLNKGNKVFGFGKQLLDAGLGSFKDAKAAFDEVKNVLKDTSEATDAGKEALSSAGAGLQALASGDISGAVGQFQNAAASAGLAASAAKEAVASGKEAVEDAKKAIEGLKDAFDKPPSMPAVKPPAAPKLPKALGGSGGGGSSGKPAKVYLELKTPFGKDLAIESFHGEERMSAPFHFTIECRSKKSSLDFKKILGKSATIKIGIDDKFRYINGVVTRFVQGGTMPDQTVYFAEIRPWFWMLTQTRDSRIFQNKKVPDIIEAVFKEYGFQKHKKALKDSYEKRKYTVQHQESDFDFVSRLMEDTGIYYFFEHTESGHTMVLADDPSGHKAIPGLKDVTIAGVQKSFADDTITECTLEEQVTTNAYTVGNYNFEVPKTTLRSTAKGKSPKLEMYEYSVWGWTKSAMDWKVKKRIESAEEPAATLRGQSRVRSFVPGYKFKTKGHKRGDLNGEYVLRWVSHSATLEHYTNSFDAMPSKTHFRPPMITAKPLIAGSETAVVVGKSGEEIWTDKYGRIRVQFAWDRQGKKDEKATCWLRVAQNWAGKQWGTWFLPRIGMEVIVTFIDGDPDKPMVTGAVYNGEQTVPYALPGKQTVSTIKTNSSKGGGGYNELRFEDKKNKEEIFIQAQKDMNIKVKHDRTTDILHDEVMTVKHDRKVTIKDGDTTLTVKTGNRKVEVKTNDTLKVTGMRKVEVIGDETHKNDKNYTHKVAGDYTLKIGGAMNVTVGGKLTIKVTKDIKVEGDANINTKAAQAYKNVSGTTFDNKSGTAFSNVAGTDMTNKAGVGHNVIGTKVDVKASAQGTVDGGGMLTVKGGMVKIN